MARKFYGIDAQGKLLVERRSGNPSAELGRWYVNTADDSFRVCPDGVNNREVVIADAGTYGINILGSVLGNVTGNVLGNVVGDLTGNADTTDLADLATVALYAANGGGGAVQRGYVAGGSDNEQYVVNTWTAVQTPNRTQTDGNGFAINDLGYMTGGISGPNQLWTDEYDPDGDSWTAKSDMPSPARRTHGASTIASKGYVYGGFSTLRLQDTDEYDPDSWTNKTNMPSPARSSLDAATVDSKGYVFGGFDVGSRLRDTDEYTPDSWANKTNMPTPGRSDPGAVALTNKIYIFGGFSTTQIQDCDEYDPDVWVSKTPMPSPAKHRCRGFELGDKVYSCGGHDGLSVRYDTEEYTPDTWTQMTDNNTADEYWVAWSLSS